MKEETETLIVPRGGSFVPVTARIAALISAGWKLGEVRFEMFKPGPAVRVPLTLGSKLPRAKRTRA